MIHDSQKLLRNFEKTYITPELQSFWKQYKEEAEHQDGVEYWDQFNSPEEIWDDFKIFIDALKEIGEF